MQEAKAAVHPRPGASVVVFRGDEVLLVQRGKRPYEGYWSLPGGEIQWGETAADAARELQDTARKAKEGWKQKEREDREKSGQGR